MVLRLVWKKSHPWKHSEFLSSLAGNLCCDLSPSLPGGTASGLWQLYQTSFILWHRPEMSHPCATPPPLGLVVAIHRKLVWTRKKQWDSLWAHAESVKMNSNRQNEWDLWENLNLCWESKLHKGSFCKEHFSVPSRSLMELSSCPETSNLRTWQDGSLPPATSESTEM